MNATVTKFNKKNDIAALIDLANEGTAAIIADAQIALAGNEFTPAPVLVELHRIAEWFDLEDLMDALLDNPKLPASALTSMDLQYV